MNVPLIVRREVQIAAPPSTVFAFLTDPEKIVRWMGTEATMEPHPGGIYLLNVQRQGHRARQFHGGHAGPPPCLQLRLGRERTKCRRDRAWSRSICLKGAAGHWCAFTHSGLPDATEVANHEKGWTHYIERLRVTAAGGDPGPDQMRKS